MDVRVARLRQIIRQCRLCPRACGVDRSAGQVGACRIGEQAVVYSAGPHFGEEPVLVGAGGSGTIFFSGCNLDCVFCQNYDISHDVTGQPMAAEGVAALACRLVRNGCENVNFVTPTHVAHVVAEAVLLARDKGCDAPVVYNCGGYESVETLQLLEGLIEIYMPDFKYADADDGRKYSGVADYPAVAAAALAEMYRQVHTLELDERGVARRGLLVRHLVMPRDIGRTQRVIDTVARLAPGCAINVMGQYHPAFRAGEFPELLGRVDRAVVQRWRRYAAGRGLVCVH